MTQQHLSKHAARRQELAEAALRTLSENGYAHTGLREIALHSKFSHGVLHYYFVDKNDLITECVLQHHHDWAEKVEDIIAQTSDADDLINEFCAVITTSLDSYVLEHRLWYDLRTQSMFTRDFRGAIQSVEKVHRQTIGRLVAAVAQRQGNKTPPPADLAFAVFDGAFQNALHLKLDGQNNASQQLGHHLNAMVRSLAA